MGMVWRPLDKSEYNSYGLSYIVGMGNTPPPTRVIPSRNMHLGWLTTYNAQQGWVWECHSGCGSYKYRRTIGHMTVEEAQEMVIAWIQIEGHPLIYC